MRSIGCAASLIAIAALSSACSTVPTADSMKVDDYVSAATHEETLALFVEGGWELPGQVSKLEFARAVEMSLVSSKVFSRLVQIESAVYRLDVVVDDVRQPPGGST